MSETATDPVPTPAPSEPAAAVASPGTPPRRARALLGYLFRSPGRFLAVAALLALISLGAWLIGVQLWAGYHLQAARAALNRYHQPEARRHVQACLRVWPDRREVLLLAARAARRESAYEQAEQFLDRCQVRHGLDEDLVFERMLLRAERGDVEAVSPFFRARVKEDHPTTPLILEALTRGFIRRFRLPDAEDCLRQWLERRPDDTQAHYLWGSLLELTDKFGEAVENFRRALDLDPQRDDVRLRLAAVLVQMGRANEAIPHLDYLRRRRPGDPEVLLYLARCRIHAGRDDQAAQLLDEVLERHPNHAGALYERGRLALRAGEPGPAEAWLRRAVAVDPGNFEARYQFHQALVKQGKVDEAREEHARLQQLEADLKRIRDIMLNQMRRSPDNPSLHYEVGMISLRAGAVEEAVRWFHSALKHDPGHAESHAALASYYERTGKADLAARHRAGAKKAGPKDR